MDPASKDFYFHATGACCVPNCGVFTEVRLGNEEDARLFINHEHGHETKHCFVGEIAVKKVHTFQALKRVA